MVLTALLATLSGCGDLGSDDTSDEGSSVGVTLIGNGSALVSWTPPTENTDNSTLTDLAGYRIYFGITSGVYSRSVDINNPGLTSYQVDHLGSSDWYFVMTAYNSLGVESAYSREVSTTKARKEKGSRKQ